jgi:hypothetical protein
MFKNTASTFYVFAFDATTNVPKTGDAANITAYVAIDGGATTVLGDTSATEMDATNAPGYYKFDAAQAETNGDRLLVTAKSATANIKVIGAPAVIYTRPQTGWLGPATAGRTLAVDASGRALADVDTIKTNPVVNGGTITFPTTATLASTTNITAGTVTTATNVTTVNGLAANVITATSIQADAITAAKIADGAIDAATFAAGAVDAAALSADAGAELADALLNRNMATGTDSGSDTVRTVRQALRILRNMVDLQTTPGTMDVKKEDDSTSSWTAVLTTDAAAEPIVKTNPAGP